MTRFLQTVMRRLTPVLSTLCRLGEHRGGNVAIIFGLAAIPVILGAGIAMDTTRAYMVKLRLGAALDAAALAVGSQSNQGASALTTILNNYFYNNYCKAVPTGASVTACTSTVATETGLSVQPTSDITAATVNFSAQAVVPTIFMRLVGINNLTVAVTAQTTKFPGMEIALVLDNTGSMLCGNTGTGNCSADGVVSSDTTCTNASNKSRICTLIPAAKQFVTTIQNAITAPQSIYISVVPYVTTVNVGGQFCTDGAISCPNIATGCGGAFMDRKGNPIWDSTVATPAATVVTSTVTITGTEQASPNQKIIKTISPNTTGLTAGMPITGTGIPTNTTISSVDSSTQVTISSNATSTGAKTLTVTKGGARTTSGNPTVTFTSNPSTTLTPGMVVTGTSIPPNTAIKTVDSTTQVTLCNSATNAAASFLSLNFYNSVKFDAAYNSPSLPMPTNSSITKNWGGCVVEQTSYNEMTGATSGNAGNASSTGAKVSNVSNPDTDEPSGGWPPWYPLWWMSSTDANTFTSNANTWTTPARQDTSTEIQGSLSSYDALDGPNQGCPAPLLPLTDLTTSAGQTKINAAINNMWPRDANGTQVNLGMIWGWRTLSSVGPFPANNSHPLDYSTANSTGWKKIVVLMTDGHEQWVGAGEYTGLGTIVDGKIGTTSISTAETNLNTRLQTICSNMAEQGILIYTIGLGDDGATNPTLREFLSGEWRVLFRRDHQQPEHGVSADRQLDHPPAHHKIGAAGRHAARLSLTCRPCGKQGRQQLRLGGAIPSVRRSPI